MHIAEQGDGPLVLLLHGWPETWHSWRHQIDALSAAGYRVAAPASAATAPPTAPDAVDQYSIFHLNGHANTSEDLVRTARARLAELAAKPAPNG